jgi:acyl carrier protein
MANVADDAVLHVVDLIRTCLQVKLDDPDLDLFDSGLVDSLAVVMLITTLEDTLAWTLPLDDFDLDNFRSARRLAKYLEASGVLLGAGAVIGEATG